MPATKQNTTQIAQRKISLIRLAEELGNVSKACEIMGYSRQAFYEIRGAATLLRQSLPAHRTRPQNVAESIKASLISEFFKTRVFH